MTRAWIRVRSNGDGSKSFVVLYRRGAGRPWPQEYAGSFRGWPGGLDAARRPKASVRSAEQEARARRDLVAGWLAVGLDPRVGFARLHSPSRPLSLAAAFAQFVTSRVDVGEKTLEGYANVRARLGTLGDLLPGDVSPAQLQSWIAENADLAPSTVAHYLSTIRQVLDYVEVEPNPASSPKLRLPATPGGEVVPPERSDWDLIKAELAGRPLLLLLLRLLEATGLRIGEALQLTWGDVDLVSGRFRISRARTKGRTAGQRWLPVPPELLDEIAALLPFERRGREAPVFAGVGGSTPGNALWTLSRRLELAPPVSPHKLRHRRLSLWFAHGIDPITISSWAGHAKASMSSDTYGHVLISLDDEWREFWLETYAHMRGAGAGREALERETDG